MQVIPGVELRVRLNIYRHIEDVSGGHRDQKGSVRRSP